MSLLDRAAIVAALGSLALKTEDVAVPEWGGTVRVQEMTGTQRDAYGRSMIGPDGKANFSDSTARLVAASVVGDDGKPLFTTEDVVLLGQSGASALGRVYEAAVRVNGMGDSAVEAAQGN